MAPIRDPNDTRLLVKGNWSPRPVAALLVYIFGVTFIMAVGVLVVANRANCGHFGEAALLLCVLVGLLILWKAYLRLWPVWTILVAVTSLQIFVDFETGAIQYSYHRYGHHA